MNNIPFYSTCGSFDLELCQVGSHLPSSIGLSEEVINENNKFLKFRTFFIEGKNVT